MGVLVNPQFAQPCLELVRGQHGVGQPGRLVAHRAVQVEGKGARDVWHPGSAGGHVDDDDAVGVGAFKQLGEGVRADHGSGAQGLGHGCIMSPPIPPSNTMAGIWSVEHGSSVEKGPTCP